MRMHNFWAQNGPFPKMRIFLENLLMSLIHAYPQAKNQSQILILTIKEYWNLIGWEPFLAITWEADFSQACSFHRTLMNHMNLHVLDKTNGVIFLKISKTMFLGHFWPFFVIFAWWGFFPKNSALSHTTTYGPLTPC